MKICSTTLGMVSQDADMWHQVVLTKMLKTIVDQN